MDKAAHNVSQEKAGQRSPGNARRARRAVSAATFFLLVTLCAADSALARDRTHTGRLDGAPKVVAHEPSVSAEAAVLIDVDSGRILYEKAPDHRMRIASLTKIVTGWIAVRSGKLDQVVSVSQNAARQEGSSIYLVPGERQTLRNLTYAMMLRSGNDAATAIAEFLAGSTEHFAAEMNRQVRELGLTHSHFTNPHGLDNPQHYSTARDMAVITRSALQNPLFHRIVSTKYHTMPWPGEKWERKLRNKNKLLWMMPGADGVKTGYTRKSGRCLASSATRDGHQVVLVVLRDGNDWVDSIRLLTYGLTAYERRNVAQWVHREYRAKVRYGVAQSVLLVPRGRLVYPLHRDETAAIVDHVGRLRTLAAPVRPGQLAGYVEYRLHGQTIGRLPLVAAGEVKAKGLFGRLRELFF